LGERKSFLLRIDPGILSAVQRWANDDLRSLNAQIEFLLRRSLQAAGRMGPAASAKGAEDANADGEAPAGREGSEP
jgi:hypothetical protein